MALILTDLGADLMLGNIFNNAWPTSKDLTLKLYCNQPTLADTTVAGDMTEAAGGGYVAKTIANGSWTITAGNDPSDAVFAEQTFTFTGALTTNTTIYGYYVVDDNGVMLWGEELSSAFTPASNGDELSITLKFQLSKGTPS